MEQYSKIHQSRVAAVDQEMKELVKSNWQSEDEVAIVLEMWQEETLEYEDKAAQTWVKTHKFLCKKKHEDEIRQEITLTDVSWQETLSQRLKKRPATRRKT